MPLTIRLTMMAKKALADIFHVIYRKMCVSMKYIRNLSQCWRVLLVCMKRTKNDFSHDPCSEVDKTLKYEELGALAFIYFNLQRVDWSKRAE